MRCIRPDSITDNIKNSVKLVYDLNKTMIS